jgi:tetratricopeptide (TPR) repeat protein/S1-C subfamily serine protease
MRLIWLSSALSTALCLSGVLLPQGIVQAITPPANPEGNGTGNSPAMSISPSIIAQQPATTPSFQAIDQIAAAVTVRIDNPARENGSGVIVARNGNTYTVLTAEHVVRQPAAYTLVTPDGQSYPLSPQTIKALPGLDMAVVEFSSPKSYSVATLANYDLGQEERSVAFLSGFPGTLDDTVPTQTLTVGTVFPSSITLFAAQNTYSISSGRELVYTSASQQGMSGGPVFDQLGRVIGIHNASETTLEADSSGSIFPMHIGRSIGVPIRGFLGAGTTPPGLVVQTTSPPRLAANQITQLLSQVQVKPPEVEVATEWLRYANQLWRVQRYAEAVEATQRALKLDPKLYQAYYVQGLALAAQKQDQKALEAFVAALKLEPRFFDGWRQQALTLQTLKRDQEALQAINSAIAIESNDAGLYLIQGNIYQSLQQFPAAQASFSKAIALKPNAYGYVQRGVAAAQQNDYTSAQADFSRAIQLLPQDYFGYLGRGLMEFSFGNSERAIADFKQAQTLIPPTSPNRGLIGLTLGLAYIGTNQYPAAVAAGNDAINSYIPGESPTAILPQAYNLRALAYSRSNNLPGAIADMTQLIKLQPKDASAYFNRGEYYIQAQDPQRAILDFNQAIALQPTMAEAFQSRGLAYMALQRFPEAQQNFNQAIILLTPAITQKPKDLSTAQLYIRRAQAHLGLGNPQGALQDLESAESLFTSRGITSGVFIENIRRMKSLLTN